MRLNEGLSLIGSIDGFILNRIIKKRQAEKPVFFSNPAEAIALVALPAEQFALRIKEGPFEGFNLAGAAYDCLRLKDSKKAGKFLEILTMAAGEESKKAFLGVALAVGLRIKKDKSTFTQEEPFLAFCRGYSIKGLTEAKINEVIQAYFKD